MIGKLELIGAKHMKKSCLIFTGIVTFLAVIYIGFSIFFQSHFCFGTTIDGIRVGGKNADQVEALLTEEIHNYSLVLAGREKHAEVISGADIEMKPVFDNEVQELLNQQSGFEWGAILFKGAELEIAKVASYDEKALEAAIDNLELMQEENQRAPVNAAVSEYSKAGYELVPADYGTTINETKLKQAVKEAVSTVAEELNLDEAGCYVDPEIGDDDEKLLSFIEHMNDMTSMTVTYVFEEEREVLDGEMISTWLQVDGYDVTVDEDAALDFIKSLGKKYNTAYMNKYLMTSYGEEVKITGGHYGWKISYPKELEQLLADLEAGVDVEREPIYEIRANSHSEPDYGDSYVEINLTAQHLFLYKEGELVLETDFVSGSVAEGNTTPTGAFSITYKERDSTLNGANYSTPVNYWMPFNGNVGMHDATWRGSFGGGIYLNNGSHGCINLPLEAAKTIYETIDKGWPVLVYKLPGTESDSVKQKEIAMITDLINSIGEVTLYSEPVIQSARALYDDAHSSIRASITNYNILVEAENALAALKAQAEAEAAAAAAAAEQAAAGATITP